ncbi:MAG: IclR family transcriptional regulator [Acidiferrobacterales bacterium]|nr:IclR family transcriptional regulator [Acidiferrobacterales bacterium]
MHLDRLITVLEAVAISGRPLSAAELHEMTELPVPTCYRLLQVLKNQGLLEDPESSNRYVIGERLVRIALLSRTDADVCSVIAPELKEASNRFGEAVFLSRFRKRGVSIIHVETPTDPTISYVHPGLGYRPLHACSCSKAIAAFAETPFRDLILKGPMKTYTEHTKTNRKDLEVEFSHIKHAGYAECVEEIEVGVSSVAAPVAIENMGVVFSVGTVGPIRRFSQSHRKTRGRELIKLAKNLGEAIQFSNQT